MEVGLPHREPKTLKFRIRPWGWAKRPSRKGEGKGVVRPVRAAAPPKPLAGEGATARLTGATSDARSYTAQTAGSRCAARRNTKAIPISQTRLSPLPPIRTPLPLVTKQAVRAPPTPYTSTAGLLPGAACGSGLRLTRFLLRGRVLFGRGGTPKRYFRNIPIGLLKWHREGSTPTEFQGGRGGVGSPPACDSEAKPSPVGVLVGTLRCVMRRGAAGCRLQVEEGGSGGGSSSSVSGDACNSSTGWGWGRGRGGRGRGRGSSTGRTSPAWPHPCLLLARSGWLTYLS